jgi:predicted nucleotidyltransferase
MKKLEEIKKILSEHKEEIRERYGIVIIGVFGSYARGEEEEGSDIDILVEIERPIGLKFFEFWDRLEGIVGLRVDVVTYDAIRERPLLLKSIEEDLAYV